MLPGEFKKLEAAVEMNYIYYCSELNRLRFYYGGETTGHGWKRPYLPCLERGA